MAHHVSRLHIGVLVLAGTLGCSGETTSTGASGGLGGAGGSGGQSGGVAGVGGSAGNLGGGSGGVAGQTSAIERPIPVPDTVFIASTLVGAADFADPPIGTAFGLDLDGVDGPPTCAHTSTLEPYPEHPGGVDNALAWTDVVSPINWAGEQVGAVSLALGIQVDGGEVLIAAYSVVTDGNGGVVADSVTGTVEHPRAAARVPLASLDGVTQVLLDGPVVLRQTEPLPLLVLESARVTLRETATGYEGMLGGVVDPNGTYLKYLRVCKGYPADVNRAHPEIPGGPCDGSSVGFKFELVPGTLGSIVSIDPERDTCPRTAR